MKFLKDPWWKYPGLILLLAVFVFSCKEDDNELGLDIQPPSDKLNVVYSDTTTVIAYSQVIDSIRSDETSLSMLGSLMDPVFGRTTNSFYTQLRLSKSSYSFGENPVADSLVLTLVYDGLYGDSMADVSLRVYEMDEKISLDTNYYSNQNMAVKPTLLAQKLFVPNYKDSVPVMGDTLIPHLRINLGEISQELIDKLVNVPPDTMETNDAFQNYFYGLKVEAQPMGNPGQIIYFDLLDNLSCMTLYYHNDEKDSLEFVYTINSNCARFEHFEHDYTLADPAFKSQVIDKDTSLGNNFLYLQALGGVKTYLKFPHIKRYFDNGKIAVNEARLFLNNTEAEDIFSPSKNLVFVIKADTGFMYTDDQDEGSDYFGGKYDDDDNGYWFRITHTVQNLMMSDDPDYGFEIYASGGSVNAQRSVLHGPSPALPAFEEKRMKLVITYTKINQ